MNMLMKTPKELMLEGKTKAYDEAWTKVKELYSDTTLSQPVKDVLEYIFPELKLFKKMEEEEIRLDIVDIIKSQKNIDGPKLDKMIDWLEKQGEKLQESIREESNKKPNKVKPTKFKTGDWVVVNKSPLLIYDICNITYDTYGVKFEDGAFRNYDVKVLENKAHLWTIDDAKDGDILIDKSNDIECLFIFKETKPSDIKTNVLNPLTVLGYCGIGGAGLFTKSNAWGDTANCTYYPATKEQQDFLFQKMAEEGYRWDSENKKVDLLPQKKPQKKQSSSSLKKK